VAGYLVSGDKVGFYAVICWILNVLDNKCATAVTELIARRLIANAWLERCGHEHEHKMNMNEK
jgi:hypothetical protein